MTTLFAPSKSPSALTSTAYRRRAAKRAYENLLFQRAAEKQIGRMPDEGETIHMVVSAAYRTVDLVPAWLALKAPEPIERLYVATLSYNRECLDLLLELFDRGQIKAISFVISIYDKANEPARFEYAKAELQKRGGRIMACQNHCKIILCPVRRRHRLHMRGIRESPLPLHYRKCRVDLRPRVIRLSSGMDGGSPCDSREGAQHGPGSRQAGPKWFQSAPRRPGSVDGHAGPAEPGKDNHLENERDGRRCNRDGPLCRCTGRAGREGPARQAPGDRPHHPAARR